MMSSHTPPPDLGELARELTPLDHERLPVPPEIWSAIDAAATAEVTSLAAHRARRTSVVRTLTLLAAASLLIVGVVGAVVATTGGSNETVIATVTITNDGLQVPTSTTAEARLIEVDGRLELALDVPELPASDGFYELWIIDTDVQGMFSLGVVAGDGRYALPDGVDPAEFPVVDVSVEPADGDPTHSGQSIWRGVLDI